MIDYRSKLRRRARASASTDCVPSPKRAKHVLSAYVKLPQPFIILERCDSEDLENDSNQDAHVLIDSDDEAEKSVEFVSQEPASNESKQIA